MVRSTPNYQIPVPENLDDVDAAEDMWTAFVSVDATMFEVSDNAVAMVQDQVDQALEPVLEMIVDVDPQQAQWDDAAGGFVFENDRASFLEWRDDGAPTDWSATAIGQSLERIGWGGGFGGGDLTQARAVTFTEPPAGPVTDAVLATNEGAVAELMARLPNEYPGTGPVPITESTQVAVRTPAGIALVIATALATGTYNPATAGSTEGEATDWVVRLATSVASTHFANSETPAWGTDLPPRNRHGSSPAQQNQWQSALWAQNAAYAAWMVWPHLTTTQREQVGRMIVHEADRMPGWSPPYWRDAGGGVLREGDSAAEDIGFQISALVQALAMYPNHPRARVWMDTLLRFYLAATSSPHDLDSRTLANGLVVGEVTGGYNLTGDYEVENHSILPHPQYWGAVGGYGPTLGVTFTMAGLPTPATLLHNAQNMWTTATTKVYDSPPYDAPGGVVWPGDGTYYSPDGNDRRPDMNQARIALMSLIAKQMGWAAPFDVDQSALASIAAQDIPLYKTMSTAMGQAYRRAEFLRYLCATPRAFSDQPVPDLLSSTLPTPVATTPPEPELMGPDNNGLWTQATPWTLATRDGEVHMSGARINAASSANLNAGGNVEIGRVPSELRPAEDVLVPATIHLDNSSTPTVAEVIVRAFGAVHCKPGASGSVAPGQDFSYVAFSSATWPRR